MAPGSADAEEAVETTYLNRGFAVADCLKHSLERREIDDEGEFFFFRLVFSVFLFFQFVLILLSFLLMVFLHLGGGDGADK